MLHLEADKSIIKNEIERNICKPAKHAGISNAKSTVLNNPPLC